MANRKHLNTIAAESSGFNYYPMQQMKVSILSSHLSWASQQRIQVVSQSHELPHSRRTFYLAQHHHNQKILLITTISYLLLLLVLDLI